MARIRLFTALVLLIAPLAAHAQSVRVVDPSTGAAVFSSANPASVKSVSTGASSDRVQGCVAHDAVDVCDPVKIGGKASYNAPAAVAVGDRVDAWYTLNGAHEVALTDKNGNTFDAGVVNTDLTASTIILPVASVAKPVTAGGLSLARIVTGTTGTIKASAGQVYTVTFYNANAAVRYLQLYNKASAPTLSTDTPVYTIPMTAGQARDINIADIGAAFATGIAWAYTTDDIAIPTTAGTSGELHATVGYK